jgi:hypothetical protein
VPFDTILRRREDLSGCCREQGDLGDSEDEEPLCLTIGSEDEVYRFFWNSSFNGSAVVRIGWRGTAATLRWWYRWYWEPAPDDSPAERVLSAGDRTQLLSALAAANFWTFEKCDSAETCLDGADWLIEGRRGNIYRGLSRWSPDGELYDLGKLFFDLAGPPLSKIELY